MNVLDLFKLDGKTALVTGAKRGIGKAMAVALAEAGADIIGVSKTLESTGSEVEREVTALGRKFSGFACDFANRESVYEFLSEVPAHVDILVNNAGTILRKPAAGHPDEYWDQIIETNLNSQFVISREIGKTMVARGAGKIIFTASLLSFQGGITVPGYAASKGAIGQLTKALSNEWAPHNVQVNAIAPIPIARRRFFPGFPQIDGAHPTTSRARRSSSHRPPPITSPAPFSSSMAAGSPDNRRLSASRQNIAIRW
jgi:2-deoxy-D-gluconate 3-dehydrogenase